MVVAFDYLHEDFILQKQQEAEVAKGNFAAKKSAWINGYKNAEEVASRLGLSVIADSVVADLEREYQVENEPFSTAHQYSVCVLGR